MTTPDPQPHRPVGAGEPIEHPTTPEPDDPEWEDAAHGAFMDQKAIVEWLGRCAPWPKV